MTLYGATDGASATGTFTLYNQYFASAVDHIRLEKGVSMKIWGARVSGAPCTVIVQVSLDGGTTYVPVAAINLPSTGEHDVEKRRPIKIDGVNEYTNMLTYVRFTWVQSTPDTSYVSIDVEFTWDE